jgi:hypothetical protein
MKKPSDPIALQVRMNEGLRRRLAKAAEENGRSLNAEILMLLAQALEANVADARTALEELRAEVQALRTEVGKIKEPKR